MRTLQQVLSPSFDVEFLVESRPLARRLSDEGLRVTVSDCTRCDSYVKVDLTPSTCVIVEDTGRKSLKRLIGAVPAWPYSRGWGYYPSGFFGVALVVILILLLMGRI